MTSDVKQDRWLDEHARHWVEAGILTADQAAAILSAEGPAQVPPVPGGEARGIPLATELMSYIGIVLVSAGGVFIVSRFWGDLAGAVRLMIGVFVAIIGLGAGFLVARTPGSAASRLAGVLWLGGTAGVALTGGVVAVLAGSHHGGVTGFVAATAAFLVSAGLWRNADLPLQFLSTVAAFCVGIATLFDIADWRLSSATVGFALIVAACVIGVLGYIGIVQPALFVLVVAGISGIAGGIAIVPRYFAIGVLLGALIATATVTAGLSQHRVPVVVTGIVGFLIFLVRILGRYMHTAGSGFAVVVLGALAVGIALWTNQRQHHRPLHP